MRHYLFPLFCVWLTACRPSTPDIEPVVADPCALTTGSWTNDTVVVALGGDVDAHHAPVPRSSSEQLLFRHLYQTLISVDCHGLVTPGLATTWEKHEDARIWSFDLRPEVSFWDGSPVTATSVREGWLLHQRESVAPWADSVASSVTITGERQLTVRLRRPYEEVPRVFADPTLAVARRTDSGAAWPLGTGAYQIAEATTETILAIPLGTVTGDDLPVLRFLDVGDDARDAIDLGADLVASRDPMVADYVDHIEDLVSLPLPWDRVYVLVAPLRTGTEATRDSNPVLPEALGIDEVLAESIRPEAPFWWSDLSICRLTGSLSVPPHPGSIAGRIVYPGSDPDSRAIAERIVAVAASGALPGVTQTRERLTAAGLSDERFARALAEGRDLGFVVGLPARVLDPCAKIVPMERAMPWVTAADLDRVLIPLVVTRGHISVSQGIGSVLKAWDGVPFLAIIGSN